MKKILTIAQLTFKESYRKKIFLILLLFGILIIFASFFFPTIDAVGKLNIAKAWSMKTLSFFSILIAIFVSAFSIPEDIIEKKIFTLLTKPLGKMQYIVGKFLGFLFVVTIFMIGMTIISIVYIRIVHFNVFRNNPEKSLSVDKEIMPTKITMQNPGNNNYSYITIDKNNKTKIRMWGKREKNYKNYIECRYEGINKNITTNLIKGRINIGVRHIKKLIFSTKLKLMFVNDKGDLIAEKMLDVKNKKTAEFDVPPDAISDDGSLILRIERLKDFMQVTIEKDDVKIIEKTGSFELNIFKVLLIGIFRIIIILGVVVMGSVFLSGPMNLVFCGFVYFVGSIIGFLRGSFDLLAQNIRIAQSTPSVLARHSDQINIPLWLLKFSDFIIHKLTFIFPDMLKFDVSRNVLTDISIPFTQIQQSAVISFSYGIGTIVIAFIIMKLREIK